jgi:hypothetical protein
MKAILRVFTSALFIAFAVNALTASTNQVPVIQWGVPAEGFELGIRLEHIVFVGGEPIRAKILLHNLTATHIQVDASVSGGPNAFYDGYGLSVLKGTNALPSFVHRTNDFWAGGIGSARSWGIAPGEVGEHEVQLSREYDLKSQGTYVVTASRMVPRLHGKGEVEITSGRSTFRVMRPGPAASQAINASPKGEKAP